MINPVNGQKNSPAYEDYDIGNDPNESHGLNDKNGGLGSGSGSKPIVSENFSDDPSLNSHSDDPDKLLDDSESDPNSGKTRFTDERFARLFPSRNGAGKHGHKFDEKRLMVKEVSKPKPTLPSFIKSTPPLIKVQITTQSPFRNNNRLRSASTSANRKTTTTTTTTTTRRPNTLNVNNRNRPVINPRPLTGRLPGAGKSNPPGSISSTTVPPPSLANNANRRRTNVVGAPKFQRNNSTIPALNPRGRTL